MNELKEKPAPSPAHVPSNRSVQSSPTKISPSTGRRGLFRHPLGILLVSLVASIITFFGGRMLAHSWSVVSTDDAFTEAHIIPVSPKIAGQVQRVHVVENQEVKAGDLLVEIDDRDTQLQVAQKKAGLEAANTNRATARSGLALVRARLESATSTRGQNTAEAASTEANAQKAQADFARAQELKRRGVVSSQEFESAQAAAHSWEESVKAAQQKTAGADAGVVEAKAQVDAAETYINAANVKVQQADLDLQQAELQHSYTRIVAPEDGRVTRKTVEPGAYVQPGQILMAVVPHRVWVVANYKETQLRDMRIGQPAEIELSAYPSHPYRGHVESIQAGSGSRFSLMPPENATGNFVKVVQRVPVKIVFDESIEADRVIGPGLSAEPEVRIGRELPQATVLAGAILLGIAVFVLLSVRAARRAEL